jgi:hypothetical protein
MFFLLTWAIWFILVWILFRIYKAVIEARAAVCDISGFFRLDVEILMAMRLRSIDQSNRSHD